MTELHTLPHEVFTFIYILIIIDDFFNTKNKILQISVMSNNPIHETLSPIL